MARSSLKGEGIRAVGELFRMYEIFDMPVEMIELTDEMIHFRHEPPCPFGLEGSSKEPCEAMEAREEKMISTILGEEVEVKVIKCIAAGDEYCEVLCAKRQKKTS